MTEDLKFGMFTEEGNLEVQRLVRRAERALLEHCLIGEVTQVLKEGFADDPTHRDRIAALLRFASTHDGAVGQTVSLRDYVGRMKGGQDKIDKSVEQKAEIIATKPVESEAEARKLAIEIFEGIAKDMVKANASVPGLPDIRSGTVLQIDGVGDRFSGRYFVTSTTHSIGDSGYTTQFECRREEI